jgi:hypothetical protein
VGVRLQRHLGDEHTVDPGQWVAVVRQPWNTRATAVICCPACGTKSDLIPRYHVDKAGGVAPAFVCANASCAFFEHLHLEGWGEEVPAAAPPTKIEAVP